MPAARRLAASPVPALQALGSGKLTFAVDDSVNPAYHQYILDLFNTVYPVIVNLYGHPSHTVHVTVHFDDTFPNWFFYNSAADQIVISTYPNIALPYSPDNPNDPQWDGIVTHELIHAFHDAVYLFASWAEEGMAEAATELAAEYLFDQGVRDIRQRVAQYNLLMSDTWNVMGADTLGGTTYSFYKAMPDLFYRAAPALFWKLTTSESQAATRDWPHYDFLKQLNESLYEYAEHVSAYVDEPAFLSLIAATAVEPVDGQPAHLWVQAQPIADIDGPAGTFLGIYPARWVLTATNVWVKSPTNPDRIYALAFERTVGQSAWDTRETLLVNGDSVDFVIEDAAGTEVDSGSIVLDQAWAYANVDTSGWAPGAYRVHAAAVINGQQLTASNVFMVGPSVVSPEDGLGLMLVDELGELIPQPVTADGGTLTLSANAAVVVAPADISHLPQAPTVDQQPVNLPLPYTRVRTLVVSCHASPADVNGDGDIDATDIQLVAQSWRAPASNGPGGTDVNEDGRVDVRDIMVVASYQKANCIQN